MESQKPLPDEFLAVHGDEIVWLWYAASDGDPRDNPRGRVDLTLREALALIRSSPTWYFYDIDLRLGAEKLRLGAQRIDALIAAAE